MMYHNLTCRALPFDPTPGQVFYISRGADEEVLDFIRGHYQWLRDLFSSYGLEFCYLPLLADEVISYFAPQLSDEQKQMRAADVPDLADYIVGEPPFQDTPLLAFATSRQSRLNGTDTHLKCVPMFLTSGDRFDHLFKSLCGTIQSAIDREQYRHRYEFREDEVHLTAEPQIRFRKADPEWNRIRFSRASRAPEQIPDNDTADRLFDQESQELVNEIKVRIEALRRRGVNTLLLRDLLDEPERLSRLYVTSDYRLLLPDYGDREIKMTLLPKAVYILFLRHLEGIRFKDLSDYYDELLQIYRELSPFGSDERQEQSIRDITDPTKNSINEKCARIREAFVSQFDDRLARHYYITGQRGAPKRITLPSHLISWEKR